MSYAAHRKDFAPYISKLEVRITNPPAKVGIWRRLLKAMSNSRRSRSDRQIARFIEARGGQLTDEIERELMRHITASPHYRGMSL
jgi:hypothetical protein